MSELHGLSAMQVAFAKEYAVDGVAAQAALRAGYSEAYARHKAQELLSDPRIQVLLTEYEAGEHAGESVVSKAQVIEVLLAMAMASVTDLQDANGKVSMVAGGALAHGVRKYRLIEKADGTRVTEVEMYDKIRAIRELSRLLGWDRQATYRYEANGVEVKAGPKGVSYESSNPLGISPEELRRLAFSREPMSTKRPDMNTCYLGERMEEQLATGAIAAMPELGGRRMSAMEWPAIPMPAMPTMAQPTMARPAMGEAVGSAGELDEGAGEMVAPVEGDGDGKTEGRCDGRLAQRPMTRQQRREAERSKKEAARQEQTAGR